MKLDFWNNPLVVSALRVRYRQGGILQLSIIWMLVLVAGGAVVQYFREDIEPASHIGLLWHHFYFLILFGVQWSISCLVAGVSVHTSMTAEVSNRTLDFQRIAALSPRQLLLGKMLGEPIQAYLMAMTSVPLAVWCWGVGVPGLTLTVLVLLYLNLFTSVLLVSSLGLVVKLELKDGKVQGGGAAGLVFIVTALSGLITWTGGPGLMAKPAIASVAALLVPIPAFAGLVQGDAFLYPVTLFGLSAPCLLVTPLCQLAVAAVSFRVMERRLCQPLAPGLGKPMAYLLLVAVDVLTAGLLADPSPAALPAAGRIALFALVHLAASLILISAATPGWETLSSWVWRFRGRWPWWRDLVVEDRSPNDLMGPLCGLIGGVILTALVVGPGLIQDATADPGEVARVALSAWAMASLLTMVGANLTQKISFVARFDGTTLGILLLGAIDSLPLVVGSYYDVDAIRQLSFSAHIVTWFGGKSVFHPLPMLLGWTALGLLGWIGWRRRLRQLEAKVDTQLRQMGV